MSSLDNKNADFEINLMPFISILAVCLSILLLTTVWVRVGAFNVNQAMGTEEVSRDKNSSSIWVVMQNDGSIEITTKEIENLPRYMRSFKTSDRAMTRKLSNLDFHLKRLKKIKPDLNIALVMPSADSSYEHIVAVMDHLKKNEFNSIGVAPL